MGKHGPCYHCGVTSTPLWRNGPPEKPVLCNACGSRWRTKGTLTNYTPLHSRADTDNYIDHRLSKVKNICLNKSKEPKILKRKPNQDNLLVGVAASHSGQGFQKYLDEDTSNRSSSGSAISNSESCAQFGSADASDMTGPSQSNVWDTMVPSKKRTCINRPKQSSVEKLTKDLYTILQEQQSSCFSATSEEDLLIEDETPMVSVEIGHGSVLIRHPSHVAREEESEASSLTVEHKHSINEAYSHLVRLPVKIDITDVNFSSLETDKAKKFNGQRMQPEQFNRDKSRYEGLLNRNTLLSSVDLSDIINFEEFAGQLTNEEQQQLMKFLPSVDIAERPDSLRSMFDSLQFKENLPFFQQLISEGVFDVSFSGTNTEDYKTLKRLALFDLTKSHWVAVHHQIKKCKSINGGSIIRGPNASTSNNLVIANRSRDCFNQKDAKSTMRSPKRAMMTKTTHENKEATDKYASSFSPQSLFAMPPHGSSSLMLDTYNFGHESSEQDLLVDVPSHCSFPQAELLYPSMSFWPSGKH